jgi:Mrp family chromosome partitioning ATPase
LQNGGKPARGRVILAATAKGGAGKSTTIACLACWWQAAGRSIALVDADPNRTLTRWHAKGAALEEPVGQKVPAAQACSGPPLEQSMPGGQGAHVSWRMRWL